MGHTHRAPRTPYANVLVPAARVRAQLVDTCPSVQVKALDRVVYIGTQAGPTVVEQLAEDLRVLAE